MAPASSASTSYSESASPQLKQAIEANFGTQNDMKLKFTNAALGLFGSGWTWLGVDPRGELVITTTPNQAQHSYSAPQQASYAVLAAVLPLCGQPMLETMFTCCCWACAGPACIGEKERCMNSTAACRTTR